MPIIARLRGKVGEIAPREYFGRDGEWHQTSREFKENYTRSVLQIRATAAKYFRQMDREKHQAFLAADERARNRSLYGPKGHD